MVRVSGFRVNLGERVIYGLPEVIAQINFPPNEPFSLAFPAVKNNDRRKICLSAVYKAGVKWLSYKSNAVVKSSGWLAWPSARIS